MKKLNKEKRTLFFKFIEMLSKKEDWEMETEFKALANIKNLEKMVEELEKNPQMTEKEFLRMIE